jgi:type IV pilus assembly protein PilA
MNKKGFTLVEVLLVIVIIAVLTAIVLVAINPARQIAQANNTQRAADVTTILNAVSEYIVDNGGSLPTSTEAALSTTPTNLGSDATDIEICTDLVPTYLAALPYDPSATDAAYTDCTDYDLQYSISADANDRVTVSAPNAQLGETISVTR